MKKYILSLDLGTTSIRAILFNKLGEIVFIEQQEFKQYFLNDGYVLHDANEIWEVTKQLMTNLVINNQIKISEIDSIGIANQRETTVLWDKQTKQPVYYAICWQSRQSFAICERLIAKGYSDTIKNKTGLPIDPYFCATKIMWLYENVEEVRQLAKLGRLAFGTIDSWIVYKLTQGALHITDYSNAARTMLYNIYDLCWDDELLAIFKIDKAILPTVVNSSSIYGHAKIEIVAGVAIASMVGDQSAAMFGQNCLTPGVIKNTYGTGCFLMMNTSNKPVVSNHGLLTTLAWGIDNQVDYALEGSIFTAGSAITWLKDSLQLISDYDEVEAYAKASIDNHGVYLVPAFVGLGTPYWEYDVQGSMFGLTRNSSKAVLIRATLEAICYQTRDVIEVMNLDSGYELRSLRCDGGASSNDFLMQFQADILNIDVAVARISETTALGAALLAGLATSFFSDLTEAMKLCGSKKQFSPKLAVNEANTLYAGWKCAVAATIYYKNGIKNLLK